MLVSRGAAASLQRTNSPRVWARATPLCAKHLKASTATELVCTSTPLARGSGHYQNNGGHPDRAAGTLGSKRRLAEVPTVLVTDCGPGSACWRLLGIINPARLSRSRSCFNLSLKLPARACLLYELRLPLYSPAETPHAQLRPQVSGLLLLCLARGCWKSAVWVGTRKSHSALERLLQQQQHQQQQTRHGTTAPA